MPREKHRKHGLLYAILGVSLGVLLFAVLCSALFWSALSSELSIRGGTAPKAAFADRQVWGKQTFRVYFGMIDAWVARSPMIAADLGKVTGIAPAGGPNRFCPGFTDGTFAQMRLEVVGTNGTGTLWLPYVEVEDVDRVSIGDDATWQFGETTHVIHESGRGYLKHFGLSEVHDELLRLADSSQHEPFLAKWPDLERALADSALPPPWSAPGKEPPLIQQLHDRYREPLLEKYAAAKASASADTRAATEALCLAARSMLERAEARMEKDAEFFTVHVASDLKNANRLLARAHKLSPEDRETLRLARERAVLQYLFSIGASPDPPFTKDPDIKERWNEHCLGPLHAEAVNYAKRSPYLKRELGRYRVETDLRNDSRLSISKDNVFVANVRLRLTGRQKDGLLMVRIRENEDRHSPIDIFAESVRHPDYPLRTSSPTWVVQDEPHVELSAKTGEPRARRSRSSR